MAAPYDLTVVVRDYIRAVVQTLLEAAKCCGADSDPRAWRPADCSRVSIALCWYAEASGILYLLGLAPDTLSLVRAGDGYPVNRGATPSMPSSENVRA